jgi:hypothetical protein
VSTAQSDPALLKYHADLVEAHNLRERHLEMVEQDYRARQEAARKSLLDHFLPLLESSEAQGQRAAATAIRQKIAQALGENWESSEQEEENPTFSGEMTLPASAAQCEGPTVYYHSVVRRIMNWRNTSDRVTFNLPEIPEGEYEVSISYGAATRDGGGQLEIDWNGQKLLRPIRPTGRWDEFKNMRLGQFKHDGGPVVLTFRAGRIGSVALMDLSTVTFKKQGSP